MNLLFILDPLESLKPYKDTSLAIMRSAAQRGHALYICEQHDLGIEANNVYALAQKFAFHDHDTSWYRTENPQKTPLHHFDVVLMRKDPPFDNEYLYSTYLLEMAEKQGVCILNRPEAIRGWNEKLSITRFPQFTPPFIVTSRQQAIREFLEAYQDIIVKPLDGMGGSGIFRLTRQDPNIGSILETITHHEQQTIMAQEYLPAIAQGDKRILIINGQPIPYALARIPKAGETRGNLAAGGKGVAQPLSPRDEEIATTIGRSLQAHGLFLVGLDVIGDALTEINVTSPTGMVEIAAQTDFNPAEHFMMALENLG